MHAFSGRFVIVAIGYLIALTPQILAETRPPAWSDEMQLRYEALTAELRCPKCLNTNIADSNAPISADLRLLVRNLLTEGYSNSEIKEHLHERYGDFILYNPPISPKTVALYALPLILILVAALIILRIRRQRTDIELTDEELERLELIKRQSET